MSERSSGAAVAARPPRSGPQRPAPSYSRKDSKFKELFAKLGMPAPPKVPLQGERFRESAVPDTSKLVSQLAGRSAETEAAGPQRPLPLSPGAQERQVPDALDPLAIALSHGPGALAPPPPVAAEAPLQHTPALDQIAAQLVKRIAWGAAGRKGAARIELGAGAWAGTTITVVSEPQGVRLELDVGAQVDGDALGERLRRRLEAKGLCVQDVVVR